MVKDSLKLKKDVLTAHLTLIGYNEEEGSYVLYVPTLDIYAYGDNEEDAHQSMKETLELFFEHLIEENTFEKELKRLKWIKHKRIRSRYNRPTLDPVKKMNQLGVDNFNVSTNQELALSI